MIFACIFAAQQLVREPQYADTFYPKENLLITVRDLVKQHKQEWPRPRIMIVPHASYLYSGIVAAKNYAQLQGHHYDTVIIIGPYHKEHFEGVALWGGTGVWQTPLGKTEIDQPLTEAMIAQDPTLFQQEPEKHNAEHALEVQLPFLQSVLKQDIKIVPLLVRSCDSAKKLARVIFDTTRDKSVLVVVTTDLSHDKPATETELLDNRTLNLINQRDPERYAHDPQKALCGDAAVMVALELAELMHNQHLDFLQYRHSGQTFGRPESVVGYVAALFYDATPDNPRLSSGQQKALYAIAKNTLHQYVQGHKIPGTTTEDPDLQNKHTVFVTLRGVNHELRGCVAATGSLYQAVRDSVINGLNDARFADKRITPEELPEIRVEVSVLSTPRPIVSVDDFILGIHGVRIQDAGLFLPEVAGENGWSKSKFLSELCTQKSGLPAECWQTHPLLTFTTQTFP